MKGWVKDDSLLVAVMNEILFNPLHSFPNISVKVLKVVSFSNVLYSLFVN